MRSITSKELLAYHKAWYQPQKMVVILSGDIDDKRAEKLRKK